METRTQQLQLRVTPSQKAAIRAAAERAGMDMSSWILGRVLPSRALELHALVDSLSASADPMAAHAVWSDIIELLQGLQAAEFGAVVDHVDTEDLPAVVANYVAALVESAASKNSTRPPSWTETVTPLDEPYFGTELASLREYLLRHAPVAFRRRNIFVDAGVGDRV